MADEEIKNYIRKELGYLGYNPKYYGTQYIMEAIYILYNRSKNIDYDSNLIKSVYPVIAKKYNKDAFNIKCNIVNATDMMVCECEEEKLIEYLGYYYFVKPGPKKIIETVLNKLQRKTNRVY